MNTNLPDKIVRLMSSFITDRKISVKINNETSDKISLNAGTIKDHAAFLSLRLPTRVGVNYN